MAMALWFPFVATLMSQPDFLVALLHGTSVAPWPWTGTCKQTHLQDLNLTECIAKTRDDLPVFEETADYEVWVISHPLDGAKVISPFFGFTHSAIALKQRNGPAQFTIEFFALDFSPRAMFPSIVNGSFNWTTQAVIGWNPEISPTEWTDQRLVGAASGAVINQFMSWVVTWHSQHKDYELWSTWSQQALLPGVERHFDDSTCHAFTEAALWELHRLDVQLNSSTVLCRNYFTWVSSSPLTLVEPGSLRYWEMKTFYRAVGNVLSGLRMGLKRWLEVLVLAIREKLQPAFFLHDANTESYFFVKLEKPYLMPRPLYLSQRFILPWQPLADARLGECDPWSTVEESGSNLTIV